MSSSLKFCNIRDLTVEEFFTGPRLHSVVRRPGTPTRETFRVHRLTISITNSHLSPDAPLNSPIFFPWKAIRSSLDSRRVLAQDKHKSSRARSSNQIPPWRSADTLARALPLYPHLISLQKNKGKKKDLAKGFDTGPHQVCVISRRTSRMSRSASSRHPPHPNLKSFVTDLLLVPA